MDAPASHNLVGPPGELRMTVNITRAATGKTETVEMVGYATPEQLAQAGLIPAPTQEQSHA